ncbi:MAG TPA: hypothetical protein VJI97_03065, partial [Candidatus Nanoarchaeia archaeon]|nr:hypothetical protein [Candidatus Nanoarchaeia archaeon]
MSGIPKRALEEGHLKTNDPRKRMGVLKSSHEAGIVNEEEFEKQKEQLENEIKEFDKTVEETNKTEAPEEPKKSDKALMIGIAFIALLLAAIFLISYFTKQEPKTIEEMHILNLQGELKPEQGYIYKGIYSFITFDNQWYTQLKSPKGTKIYDLALRYSPKDIEQIDIKGVLDENMFNNKTEFYYTFNPKGTDFSYVALAVADFSTHMAKAFDKNPI